VHKLFLFLILYSFFRKRNRNRKNNVKAEQSTQNGTVEETTLPSTISIQVSNFR
jgi:hypothetical protein